MKSKKNTKQDDILTFIISFTKENGYPPSVREIGKAVDLNSTSTVHYYLEKLKKAGKINRNPSKTRAIKPITADLQKSGGVAGEFLASTETVDLPLIGDVAAGQPILAEENITEYVPVPAEFVPVGLLSFILKVKGDSMIDIGILNGDYIIVKNDIHPVNGDKVVAIIDTGATVKTFYKEDNHIRLQPENSSMEPIICENDIQIAGIVCGLLRRYT